MRNIQEIITTDFNIKFQKLEDDSRKITENDIFIAMDGLTYKANKFLEDVINKKAVAIISKSKLTNKIPNIVIEDLENELPNIYEKYYNNTAEKLMKIGITGTDGKTTTTTFLMQMINSFSSCGYLGTNGYMTKKRIQETEHTTPVNKEMYRFLNDMYADECDYVALEVSSHALCLKRIDGLKLSVIGITNIKQDHLDFHGTVNNYIEAKELLFKTQENAIKVYNMDDQIIKGFINQYSNLISFGIENNADIMALNIILHSKYTEFDLQIFDQTYKVRTITKALFNVYNILLAVGVLKGLNISNEQIIKSLEYLNEVKGRMNFIDEGQSFTVLVDFAHTINAINEIYNYVSTQNYDNIYVVTGAAGNRDQIKRPIIGKFILENSKKVFLTIDDPAFEDPYEICKQMVSTSQNKNFEIEINRKKAIKKAMESAKSNDIVLILGKGADDFMEVKGEYLEYNEIKTVRKCIKEIYE